jgi:hypothetical protein
LGAKIVGDEGAIDALVDLRVGRDRDDQEVAL